ncbi:ethanolamine utilization protein EutN [Salmonella enterica subsp. arizonae]|uniref:Ethanolamine utilization protein EutN n=1 Tax=Salmonella enterica subsp. arizonae TaxID=59203 RepID=A0A379T7F2_SALER|nr:ethanolamine utilization protein EutN [Salmonella enterica subsp. arizonae]
MKLAVVTGQIVCTVRHQGLAHDKLLMVEMIDAKGNPDGQCAVAIDSIGREPGSGYCWSAVAPHVRRIVANYHRSICASLASSMKWWLAGKWFFHK